MYGKEPRVDILNARFARCRPRFRLPQIRLRLGLQDTHGSQPLDLESNGIGHFAAGPWSVHDRAALVPEIIVELPESLGQPHLFGSIGAAEDGWCSDPPIVRSAGPAR